MKERPILFSGEMVRAILAGRKTQTRRQVKPQWSPDVDEVSERPALDPILKCIVSGHSGEWEDGHGLGEVRSCPYGQPGDRLWVRETWGYRASSWNTRSPNIETHLLHYKADEAYVHVEQPNGFSASPDCKLPKPRSKHANESPQDRSDYLASFWHQWRPAIFMQRWMSRITLEVTAVRVERLQDISEDDARAEGASFHDGRPIGHHGWRHDIHHGFVYPTAKASYVWLWEQINGPGSWAANPWVWVIEFVQLPSPISHIPSPIFP